jgi:effector-binding domain-containing protein
MIDTPAIVQTEPLHYAALHLEIPVSEIQKVMFPGINEVLAVIKSQGRTQAGPWFTHHFHRPTDSFDFEICFPVDAAIRAEGRVEPGVMPAMTVARTVYHGSYAGLPHAWPELEQWMMTEGHKPGVEMWERYIVDQAASPADLRTELNWPLA